MLFNSWQYASFLPIIFILYWILPHKYRWILLLISSYYFYMSWNAKYVFLILFTTAVSYFAARLLEKKHDDKVKKIILSVAAILCLTVLFVFKYLNFFFDTINYITKAFSISFCVNAVNLILPVGISFYTFQTLSYVIDVYKERIPAEKNFGIYATFVSFFPQLVAGPIERSSNLLPQIKTEHVFNYNQANYGIKLIAIGLFKKMVVADNIAPYVDSVFGNISSFQGFSLLLANFLFIIQLYCDFSGYSDIARGSAKLLGIELMENFKSPLLSTSIKEYWSRWHISLSTWFRDYIYIPLGGNRCKIERHFFNLLVTFLISGLWHGASWMFVIWGGLHGFLSVFESVFKITSIKPGNLRWAVKCAFTFFVVALSYVFFRSQSLDDALYLFRNMFSGIVSPITYFNNGLAQMNIRKIEFLFATVVYFIPLFLIDRLSLSHDIIAEVSTLKAPVRISIYVVFVLLITLFSAVGNVSFVYFQF